MSFFKQFPKRQYDFQEENGSVRAVVDLFRHVDVSKVRLDGYISYTYYDVRTGERPDTVSTKLYGTPDYYWTFFIINNSLKKGLRAWPKTDQELERYIANRYDSYKVGLAIPYTETDRSITLNGVTTTQTYTQNTFNGLDLTHPYLRLRKYNSTAYALIDSWDVSKFQLTLRNINDSDGNFFIHSAIKNDGTINGRNQYYIETYNPYPSGDTNFNTVNDLNAAWRIKYKSWCLEHRPELWANWTLQRALNDSNVPASQNYYSIGLSESDENLQFEKFMSNSFRVTLYALYDGRNAPYTYLNGIGSTERVSAQNALITSSIPATTNLVEVDQVTIQNAANESINGVYVLDTATGRYNITHSAEALAANPSLANIPQYFIYDTASTAWRFYILDLYCQLPTSVTEAQGFWFVSGQTDPWSDVGSALLASLLRNSIYTAVDFENQIQDMGNLYDINPASAPFQSNVEREREVNESLQRIRVVKKRYIQEFAEAYRDLLNE